MYEECAKQALVKQTELSTIQSELLDINEQSCSLISEILQSLDKIHPYTEPNELAVKTPGSPVPPEANSLVNSLKSQLRFSRENLKNLRVINRHLNTLI